jgi:hypothetical protein
MRLKHVECQVETETSKIIPIYRLDAPNVNTKNNTCLIILYLVTFIHEKASICFKSRT